MKMEKVFLMLLPQNRFERHSVAWIAFLMSNAYLYSIGQPASNFIDYLADYILSLPLIFLITYLTVYLFIPKLLLRGKFFLFVFSFLSLLIFLGIFEIWKTYSILIPLINPGGSREYSINIYSIARGSFFIFIPTIYFITIKYARDWYRVKVLKTEEESIHLKNELKFLKSQVYPHFLLVTLSNLEEISKEKPEKAAPGIEKISEILNYILYECNVPQIRLSKEIKQIQSFIELQELNFQNKLKINYSIIGPTIEVVIAPLMAFTIVEFFFKKKSDIQNNEMKLSIFLEIFHNILNFTVEGEYFEISVHEFENDTGIINLKKRISLLYGKKGELLFSCYNHKSIIQLNLPYN
jgi:two-component system, LytTR family, sensor kinase